MIGMSAQQVPLSSGGTRPRVEGEVSAVVVGGGLAGLAAATVLAERGVKVTVLERERFLGGRAGGWTDHLESGEPFEMERGFHAFFRQYYNLRNLLRRTDPGLRHLTPLEDYPILGPDGARETFTGVPKTPPLNMLEIVRRTPTLHLSDMPKLNGPAALEMLAYDRERTYRLFDDRTAKDYLDSLRFPPRARQVLFNVFAHSFFNPEEGMSAADMIAMFHFYFTGNPEGLVFDVLCEPLSIGVFAPLRRYLEGLGVTFELGKPVRRLGRRPDGGFAAHVAGRSAALEADLAVLAVEVPALKALLAASPELDDGELRAAVEGLDVTLPFAVWRLWLDKPPRHDREPFIGVTGLGELDLLAIYDALEGESRRWSMVHGGAVVELHAYAVPEEMTEEDIKADLLAQMHALFPETRGSTVLEERFLLRRDCPAFPPGSFARRPPVETATPGLALAGDFVRMPFPCALMEKATASGLMAASALLAPHGVRAEPIWSVPPKGLTARLYR